MDIEKEVKAVIVEQLGIEPGEIKPESSFAGDFRADSLDAVEIILQLEDKLEVEIPNEDAEKMTTVGEIIKYIKEKKAMFNPSG